MNECWNGKDSNIVPNHQLLYQLTWHLNIIYEKLVSVRYFDQLEFICCDTESNYIERSEPHTTLNIIVSFPYSRWM